MGYNKFSARLYYVVQNAHTFGTTSHGRCSYCSVSDTSSMPMALRRSTDTDTLPLTVDSVELDTIPSGIF